MAYVITQNCCKDASCVPVCPVDCIRPAGGAGEFTATEMLYIDPETCIDCGACLEECPVDAIHYEDDLPDELLPFKEINSAYFQQHPLEPDPVRDRRETPTVAPGSLRVAIVGAGPAGCYAANELLAIDGVEVNMFDRLPTPFGLIRAGVAPDHQSTKEVVNVFGPAFGDRRFGCYLNVEVGRDVSHDELLTYHHAVIYAVGASQSRSLGIPGEDLPGSHAAADFVGWYNGHPDHTDHHFDLSSKRAVIVGNGNVALDVARILVMDRGALAKTDIADHALEALSDSAVEEVVVIGRRGLRDAAFTAGEFLALGQLDGVDIIIERADLDERTDDVERAWMLDIAREIAARPSTAGHRRIVFRFHTSPTAVVGESHASGLHVRSDGAVDEELASSLILRSIGYRGSSLEDLPFDSATGVMPNAGGQVLADTTPVPGVYVTGWIKRGPRGVIGTNRSCAEETVTKLLSDFESGRLTGDSADAATLQSVLAARGVSPVNWSGWRSIDAAERQRGRDFARPRVKFVTTDELIGAAAGAQLRV